MKTKSLTRRDFMKVSGLGLGAVSLMALTGCSGSESGSSSESTETTETAESTETAETAETAEVVEEAEPAIEKPTTIKVMVDGTVPTQANGGNEFWEKCEELTGIHFEVTQPDHSGYYDVVGQTIASGDWPDVIILNSTYYPSYANEGVLWDMTEAYEGSELQERFQAAGSETAVDAVRIGGHLYGMPVTYGNGCITYIKQSWLDNVGMDAPTNYEEYIDMLTAFVEGDPDGNGTSGDIYGVSASKFVSSDSPYVKYWPEFYQDAWPGVYQEDDGTWVDGFTEDAMKEALQRMADAYAAGLIDPQSLDQSTSDARNKFYSDQFGVFTYWAGTWATDLKSNLENNDHDGELVAIAPIEEVPYYYDRVSIPWCITSTCENPEGVFEYFISAMLDGGEVETLFTYGVEGIHWSTEAETLYEGTDNEVTYEEGEFHMLDNLESPGAQYTKAHIDPLLALIPIEDDPGTGVVQPEAAESSATFQANCYTVPLVPSTDVMTQYNGDLTTKKNELIAQVIIGEMTIEEAYEEYAVEAQGWSDMIVESLNAL